MDKTLKKSYTLLSKIVEQLGNKTLYYSVQVGTDSEKGKKHFQWAAYIAPPAEGLSPITIVGWSDREFLDRLTKFKNRQINEDDIYIAYQEALVEGFNKKIIESMNEIDITKKRISKALDPQKGEKDEPKSEPEA